MSLYAMYTDSTPAEIFIGDEVSKIKAQEKIGVLIQVILSQAKLNKAKKFQLWKNFAFDDNGIAVWIYLIKTKLNKLIKVKSRRLTQVIAAAFYQWKLTYHEEKINKKLNLAYEQTENELQSEIKELEFKINSLQVKNDELGKVHAHFANRSNIFHQRIQELMKKPIKSKEIIKKVSEKRIEQLEEENFNLEAKVKSAEFCLRELMLSAKALINLNLTTFPD